MVDIWSKRKRSKVIALIRSVEPNKRVILSLKAPDYRHSLSNRARLVAVYLMVC